MKQRQNKRISRSPAEYGKYKQKRKRYKRDKTTSKTFDNSIHQPRSFFNKLFLLQKNRKPIRKRKYIRSLKAKNANAITNNSNTTVDIKNDIDFQSREDRLCEIII